MEWMNNWTSWLSSLGGWFAVTAAGAGLLAYAIGLKSVLGILEKIIDVVSPLLKTAVEAVVGAAKWSWNNIFWPGIKDIFDSWFTTLTVIAMGLILWSYMDLKVDGVVDQLSFCQSENERLTRLAKKIPGVEPGPFDWLFKW